MSVLVVYECESCGSDSHLRLGCVTLHRAHGRSYSVYSVYNYNINCYYIAINK